MLRFNVVFMLTILQRKGIVMFNLRTRVLYITLLISAATGVIIARERTFAENAKEGLCHAKDTVAHAASTAGEKIEAGATEVVDFSKDTSHKFYVAMKNAYEQVGHYIKNVFSHPDDLIQSSTQKNGVKVIVNQNNPDNCIFTIEGIDVYNEQPKCVAHVEYDFKNRLPIAIVIELTTDHHRYAIIIEHPTDANYAGVLVKRLDLETDKGIKSIHIKVGNTIVEYIAALIQGLQLEKSWVEVDKKHNKVTINAPFRKQETKNLSVKVK